jgi:glycerol-3-phosphate acyltransferase PlsY
LSYQDALSILVAYLVGGIPFSYVIGRWKAGVEVRERGEGSVGARNVYHVAGPAWGVLAAFLDVGTGLAAYLIAEQLAVSRIAVLACGFAAPLGHNFSPFLRFRGGKGVATTGGFLLGFFPLSSLCGGLLVTVVYVITRDMNKALVLGIPGIILLPPVFGKPLWTVAYVLSLFLPLAVKKAMDAPHERAVWARDPWKTGAPGFHRDAAETAGREKEMHP